MVSCEGGKCLRIFGPCFRRAPREHPCVSPRPVTPVDVSTYDDHRIAMSFAITALRAPGVRLRDPGCVAKTFPDFFDRLAALS